MRLHHTLPLLVAAILPDLGRAQSYAWSLRGYTEFRFYDYAGARTDPTEIDLTVRPRFKLSFPENGDLVFEPQVAYAWGRNNDLFEDWGDVATIERLYADVDYPKASVTFGKQALNWGSALVFNPTDVFDDVFLRDTWAENSGHPALKVAVPLGQTAEVVGLLASDDRFEEGLLAARGRATFGQTEIALTAFRDPYRRADVYGFDVKGEAVVGLWLEAARTEPWDDRDGFFRAVAGTDYSWKVRDGLYLALQYYHDESGSREIAGYDLAALIRRERATLARDYATLNGRLTFSQDLTLGTLTIGNLDDSSVLSTVYGEWTRIPHVTITVGGTWLGGKPGGEFNPPDIIDPQGLLPTAIAYAWVRYYF
ncbi:MAG: hypothetical protein U0166_01950 [Acidobacteriota bacterium]